MVELSQEEIRRALFLANNQNAIPDFINKCKQNDDLPSVGDFMGNLGIENTGFGDPLNSNNKHMPKKEFYRTSSIKRERRTRSEVDFIKQGLIAVLNEYHPMTVRQVFYQMTSRGYIPKTEQSYRGTICRLLSELRLSRVIPFGYISDNTRWMRKPKTFDSMEDMLNLNKETYRRALWSSQPVYLEIWIEKDALAGVVYDVTEQWDVPLMVTRGYASLSYLYEAAQVYETAGKPVYIYYLGDYDPSGVDINRSVESRMREFAPNADIHFERIAITPDQIKLFNLPTRPTKPSDTRSRKFESDTSVELDAMEPQLLRELVEHHITKHVNTEEWVRLQQIEKLERQSLEWVTTNMHIKNGDISITREFKEALAGTFE